MKRQKIQIICSPERLKEIMSGPGPITGFLTRDEFQIPYYDTIKINGSRSLIMMNCLIKLLSNFIIPHGSWKRELWMNFG